MQTRFTAQLIEHQCGKATIPIVQHGRMHRPFHAFVDVGHRVLRDDDARPAGCEALVDQHLYAIVIGPEDLRPARFDLRRGQRGIAGNLAVFADRGYRRGRVGIAVAVDHEAGIVLRNQRRIQRRRHPRRDRERTDVPGDMPLQFGGRQSQ